MGFAAASTEVRLLRTVVMPAFATEKGGILSDQQIESLVKFLVETPLPLRPPSR